MRSSSHGSITQKLTWMNMLVCGVALVVASSAFISYDLLTFRKAKFARLSAQAQMVSVNSAITLASNDKADANKILASFQADPNILDAAIYTVDGKPFATYTRAGETPIAAWPQLSSGRMEHVWNRQNDIVLGRMIVTDGVRRGIVYIRSDVQALYARLELYGGIGAIVLILSMLAALGVSRFFRRAVAEPIVQLAKAVQEVSLDKRHGLRFTQIQGLGEVSVLAESFNQMIDEIARGKESLQHANDQLEERVKERTAELVSAQQEIRAFSDSVVKAKEDIERASRFKDQFLSTMSHELRTPLNAVLGFSDLLADVRYGPLNDRQHRYVTHIHTSGQHLLRLINDILDLSKIEAGRLQLTFEDVKVDACFGEVADALQPLVDKNSHQLVVNAMPGMVVRADHTRFKQMLMNLLGNAIKFTPKGGRIELNARPAGEFVRVEVRDSGPGIPPEEQKKIFEAFHRVRQQEKAAEGTGLGLAITRSLVELHGGALDIESELGSGSCFFFTLPSVAPAREVETPELEAHAVRPLQARILVVEDDPASADLLESQLSSEGYEVVVCNRCEDAVQMAIDLQPAVITLDIVMLPVNGWDILAKLKSEPRTAKIGVVVVTVVDQRSTGAVLGADEYVVKPVDKAILLAAVERCLDQKGKAAPNSPVLVVEDDAPTREFIADLLGQNGYAVKTAADGEQARKQVKSDAPGLVILDLMLPQVSGFRLIAEWRKDPATASLPIFVLTNKDLSQEEREYLNANTGALFAKHEEWGADLIREIHRIAPAMGDTESVLSEAH
jgi:signal transduction histidine kinase/DNA-binding response OmpR family regulator